MWRRDIDQKMARLMNLRDTLPQEVEDTEEFCFLKNEFLI